MFWLMRDNRFRGSIVVSISARHAEDPGSIPGRGVYLGQNISAKVKIKVSTRSLSLSLEKSLSLSLVLVQVQVQVQVQVKV